MRQLDSKIRIFCSIRQFNLVKITHSHAVKCLSSNNGNCKTFHQDFLQKQPTQNLAIINNFFQKNPERKCSENLIFAAIF